MIVYSYEVALYFGAALEYRGALVYSSFVAALSSSVELVAALSLARSGRRARTSTAALYLMAGAASGLALAAVVMLLAIINGIRASSTTVGGDVQKRIGLILILLVILQVTLGLLATILVMGRDPGEPIPVVEVIITSAHQANGGLLLAAAVLLTAWQSRLERT